jgi:hypothetical protein
MVSSDTAVHAAVVAVSIAALLVLNWAFPNLDSSVLTFVGLVCYGFVLGGAHLVLAVLGTDGVVPVTSRWRFVGLVAGVVGLAAVSAFTDPVPLGPVSSDLVLGVVAVAGILAYWVLEAASGYEDATVQS